MAKDLYTNLGLSGTSTVSEIQLANGVVEKYDSSLVECAMRGVSEEETFRLKEVGVVPQMPDFSGSISQQDIMSNPHLTGLEIPSVANNKTVQLIIGINSPALHVSQKSDKMAILVYGQARLRLVGSYMVEIRPGITILVAE